MMARIAVGILLVAAGVFLLPAVEDGVVENVVAEENACVRNTCSPDTPVDYQCRAGTSGASCGS